MNFLKRFCIALAFCLAGSISVWGQSARVVYVATGDTQVYAVTTDGTPTALISATAYRKATFNSLTIGPDNTGDFSVDSQGNYNFFLYACDNSTDNIIRFEFSTSAPSTPIGSSVLVTTAIPSPVCGRVGSNVQVTSVSQRTYATTTKSGNLYVSSGSDVYEITQASSTPNDGTFIVSSSPVITSTTASLGGMTQKNSGDLLVVGPAGSVLRAEYLGGTGTSPFQNTFSAYITDTSDLTNPVGIARAQALEQSDPKAVINDFFVANSVSGGGSAVYGFDPSGSLTTPFCNYSSFSADQTPTSIAGSEDNYLYVGVTSKDASGWGVQVLNTGCQSSAGSFISLGSLSSLKLSKTGPSAVAVPAVAAAPSLTTPPPDPSSGPTNYNFGSSLLQLAPASSCAISDVKQTPMSLTFLQNLTNHVAVSALASSLGSTWYGGAPAPGNGESGFGTLYSFSTTPESNCAAQDVEATIVIGGFFDPAVVNPRIIHCENFTGCELLPASGDWPTGGYLPNDSGTYGGKTPTFGSQYFVVNGNLTPNTSDLGYFCGFENPLTSVTYDTTSGFSGPFAVFNSGQGVSVKFKLGADKTCSSGNFVTDAYALLSIVQVRNGQGQTVFDPIQIDTQGNSTDNPPIFKWNSSSQNYQFSLNLTGYNPGIYELSVTFLTNNARAVYTYFQVQ